MPVITEHDLNSGKSKRGGWSRKQLALLGVAWPPAKGWKESLLGKTVSERNLRRFLEFNGVHNSSEKKR